MKRLSLIFLAVAVMLTSCQTTPPDMNIRNQRIILEAPGDYWIGRRVAVKHTRFWGYVRRPRQPWKTAQLVIFNETEKLAPDRLAENPAPGQRGFQFDNNYEYRIKGSFSGRKAYDPNSDKILPEFILKHYELLNTNPGFLFHPREKRDPFGIPVPPR
ncbi:MAG: hypothetical protein ACR2OZ_13255 [Verrucomicrobiales bacterium]